MAFLIIYYIFEKSQMHLDKLFSMIYRPQNFLLGFINPTGHTENDKKIPSKLCINI